MRIRFKTRNPDEPLYFGFDPTPHFSTFRLSEPAVLFLSKGLKLTIHDGQVVVLGGPELRIAVALNVKSPLQTMNTLQL
jgi:hypothetical protein